MRLGEIIELIEESYPRELALDWDNPGLIVGHGDREVASVLLALDADRWCVNRAIELGVDAVITHHPVIFGSIRKVSDEDALGMKLLSLIEHSISVYSMHTNFDIARCGMSDAAAKRLGVSEKEPLEATGDGIGVGFVYETGESLSAPELARQVKKVFELPSVTLYDAARPIRRIACCPGSGRGMEEHVLASGADAFITGDMSHHDGLDYLDRGISLIDAGHYGIEHIFTGVMEDFLHSHYPALTIYRGDHDERIFI